MTISPITKASKALMVLFNRPNFSVSRVPSKESVELFALLKGVVALMYIYIYICIYIYMYVYIYIYVYTSLSLYIYIYTYIEKHIHVYV